MDKEVRSNAVAQGKNWLQYLLVPPSHRRLDPYEGGSPDFATSPGGFNLIKRGSFSTTDLNPGALLGSGLHSHTSSSRRGSDFKSIEAYSSEMVKLECNDIDHEALKDKLSQVSANLLEHDVIGAQRQKASDEDVFSLEIDVASLSQHPITEAIQDNLESNPSTINRFLPNNWLFAKKCNDEEEQEKKEEEEEEGATTLSRKTSQNSEISLKRPITQTAKSMMERRELNVLIPQGM